jgi:hypothetical protein
MEEPVDALRFVLRHVHLHVEDLRLQVLHRLKALGARLGVGLLDLLELGELLLVRGRLRLDRAEAADLRRARGRAAAPGGQVHRGLPGAHRLRRDHRCALAAPDAEARPIGRQRRRGPARRHADERPRVGREACAEVLAGAYCAEFVFGTAVTVALSPAPTIWEAEAWRLPQSG